MNKGIILAVCIASAALALGTISLLTAASAAGPASDGGVIIGGFGNSGNSFNASSTAARLAREAMKLNLSLDSSNDLLREVLTALQKRALQGDAEAAAIVFELAALERAKQTPAAKAEPPPR